MDEKKKIVVMAVLAVMTLGIGAFQFMPKGEAPVVTVKQEVPAFMKEQAAAELAAKEGPRNPLMAANLAARDPFQVPASMQVRANIDSPVPPPLREPTRRQAPFNLVNVRPAPSIGLSELPQGIEGGIEKAAEPEAPFGYTVGGVVVGARPAVVFRDVAGNQRLVMQGGEVDGDSTLKLVRMDHVVVIYKGKSLRLKVGGETVAK